MASRERQREQQQNSRSRKCLRLAAPVWLSGQRHGRPPQLPTKAESQVPATAAEQGSVAWVPRKARDGAATIPRGIF